MKTLMISESHFPGDVRIRQEAFKLIDNGHNVSLIALGESDQSFFEQINSVNVYRIPKVELFKRSKHKKKKKPGFLNSLISFTTALLGYSFEFAYFTISAFIVSLFVFFRQGFDVIHTHNPPDTLFIIACFYKIFGKKFIYDHHDLSPDLFTEKYGSNKKIIYWILLMLEKISCKTADFIIATNESYKEVEISRNGADPEKIFIVRNGPDLNKIQRVEPIMDIRKRSKAILGYLGAINVQDGVDNLILVLDKIVNKYNHHDVCLMIIGDGDYLFQIKELVDELNLTEYVIFTGYVGDVSTLNKYMSTVDIFMDAAPSSFLNDRSTFIKHMEYMVFGKPVVSFSLKESIYSLKDAGLFIPSNDIDKMAESIIELSGNSEKCYRMGQYGLTRVKELSWHNVSVPLIELYSALNDSVRAVN